MSQQQAVVTGGRHGLGKAMAEALRVDGLHVLAPGSAELDVVDSEAVKEYLTAVNDLDLLVCNAGITVDKPLTRMSEEDWDRVLQVNLKGAFLCAREAAKGMVKRRAGHIVFISSFSAVHPPAGQANYAASKAALIGMMKSMAQELGKRNVRVNVILPGFLETSMTDGLSEKVKQTSLDQHTLGRLNTPEMVADFVSFLHRQMPNTSGQVFNLDSRVL
jgi:NAD(P)-dependent dehydrogenase (short-subunit alcohol dehydrogenase family)